VPRRASDGSPERSGAEELARHAQVQQQPLAVVQRGDQILAEAFESLEAAAPETSFQDTGAAQEEVAVPGGRDPVDHPADQQRCQPAARDLDLW